ncbi:MAG: S46 family peptidase [Chromatiaceae bacterium]|nr:S46 family peptidase [Chromatiaceae bacterium]
MNKIVGLALSFGLLGSVQSQAYEGFWSAYQLQHNSPILAQLDLTEQERARGLPLTQLHQTVVRIGRCTGAFVSATGLLLTSADCVADYLPPAALTTYTAGRQNATHRAAEQPLPGLSAKLLLQSRDVSNQVQRALGVAVDAQDKAARLAQLKSAMLTGCQSGADIHCQLVAEHHGLLYRLEQYRLLNDIRLVYLPPPATDDARGWPRYAANYVLLRVYGNKQGVSLAYDATHQPWQSHFARLSNAALTEQQLILTAMFPGQTRRYRPVSELKFQFDSAHPQALAYQQQMLQLLRELVPEDSARSLRYAGLLTQLQQQFDQQHARLQQYQRSALFSHKLAAQQALSQWINTSPVRQQLYEPILQQLESLLMQQQQLALRDLVLNYLQYARLPALARELYQLAQLPYNERVQAAKAFLPELEAFEQQFDARVDMELALHFLGQYARLPAELRLAALDQYFALNDGFNRDIVRHKLSAIYRGTGLTRADMRQYWLGRPASDFVQSQDPLLSFTVAIAPTLTQLARQRQQLAIELEQARAAAMEVVVAYNDAHNIASYTDANGSFRISLGRVSGFAPDDAVWYQPFSRLAAWLGRQSPLQLAETVPDIAVNFLASNDSCHSNPSGISFNQQGELVGVMFGAVPANLLSDWQYQAQTGRTVQVDARFIRWQLKQAGQTAILAELDNLAATTK